VFHKNSIFWFLILISNACLARDVDSLWIRANWMAAMLPKLTNLLYRHLNGHGSRIMGVKFWQTVKLEDARDPKTVLSFELFSAVQLNLSSRRSYSYRIALIFDSQVSRWCIYLYAIYMYIGNSQHYRRN